MEHFDHKAKFTIIFDGENSSDLRILYELFIFIIIHQFWKSLDLAFSL